jgi:POT family proton-dependent oligopeptide transporter
MAVQPGPGEAPRRQPKAHYLLFMTELWERFGLFVMATLFVLYPTDELKLPDDEGFLTFGAYSPLAYLTTAEERAIYESGFTSFGLLAISAGLVLLALAPLLRRMMGPR